MKKTIFILILSTVSYSLLAQLDNSVNSIDKSSNLAIALGISASTNGLGGNITAAWKDKLALRLGYETLDLSFPNALAVSYTHLDVYKRQTISVVSKSRINLTGECSIW